MVRVITAEKKHDCEHLLGQFLDESHYDILIDEDCDFYVPLSPFETENGEGNIAFKFRKNVYSEDEQEGAYEGLVDAAGISQNRGIAAGPRTVDNKLNQRDWVTYEHKDILNAMLDLNPKLDGSDPLEDLLASMKDGSYKKQNLKNLENDGQVWLTSGIVEKYGKYEGFFETWLESVRYLPRKERAEKAKECIEEHISNTTYANPVNSGIAGYFDRYPRIPYGRATTYTEHNPGKFSKSFPYLKKLNQFFKDLLPERWARQNKAVQNTDPRFIIADTVFTTLTVNKTFRTAAHLDAGDLGEGFSNLGVVTKGKDYKGGYLVLPEYRVAINIRPGDVLLIANHTAIHGNTKIEPKEEGCCLDCIERVSIVAYYREKMLELGSWEYELARKEFVESRRKNPDHPLRTSKLWNGVSPNMFASDEWFRYLSEREGGLEMLKKYHPNAIKQEISIEDLF